MHPTSLPGKYGIGSLGKGAKDFIDFLEKSGQKLWQILPLGPVGYGESPYSAYSSFAGNPLMIDIDLLVEDGYLEEGDLLPLPEFNEYLVDFTLVREWKTPLLIQAASNFLATSKKDKDYTSFKEEEAYWLKDFATFMAVKEYFENLPESKLKKDAYKSTSWNAVWDPDIRQYEASAVAKWQKKLSKEIAINEAIQYFFFKQWKAIKLYANNKGIKLIGDIPIFVAPDSADVWAKHDAFLVDKDCAMKKVAGVPPDYFSPEGQRWGNPLYNWKYMKENGFQWWIQRIESMLKSVDIARIDHFRGFQAYWEIDAKEETAINGKWVKAAGEQLFKAIEAKLGKLPIIAEDLGHITPEVHALRKKLAFPGMKILQFAFEFNEKGQFNAENGYLPHNCEEESVIYTGTHDNDTTLGWYYNLPESTRDLVRNYLGRDGSDIVWDMIRVALASASRMAIFPMQDLLCYGSDTRMNVPSTVGGVNWGWRLGPGNYSDGLANRLNMLTKMYGR